jgi:PERQ amino acid-rich with GYF domain-containing protein
VLGGGDSWTARRKAAEALSKSTGASRELVGETEVKIKEEDEEPDIANAVVLDDNVGSNMQPTPEQFNATSTADETSGQPETQAVNNDMADLSLGNASQYKPEGTAAASLTSVIPQSAQAHLDLASVEWSYLDPQGNVQGKCSFYLHVHHK